MEGTLLSSHPSNEHDFDLKQWHLRSRISKENKTSSRRFSASYIRSFREDSSRSFRSTFTISSTASSPGYPLKDEIDPSTYSFTTALKALQAKSGYVWECVSPEEIALNSKWNEAERYIRNPLSGEVPMECLSSKTLNGRSFRSYMASRVTMSAPLVYSRRPTHFSNLVNLQPPLVPTPPHQLVIQEKQVGFRTRDVGIQSSLVPNEGNSSSPSATSTPSIRERSINRCEDTGDQDDDIHNSTSSVKSRSVEEVEVKVTREEEETKRSQQKKKKRHKKTGLLCVSTQFSGCSFVSSWKCLFIKSCLKDKSFKSPKKSNVNLDE
ncbi:hypothetical protein RND81_10G126000 [Saponaria officinalis]|uniref:Uncharacterized protein n=1 Tax=Saponaria officinalis TaxID=3572 RepID=A0AAW1I3T9_SAPOF